MVGGHDSKCWAPWALSRRTLLASARALALVPMMGLSVFCFWGIPGDCKGWGGPAALSSPLGDLLVHIWCQK